jgi:hypothetical protein
MFGPCRSVITVQAGGVHGHDATREGCIVVLTLHGESTWPGVTTSLAKMGPMPSPT